MADSVSRQRTTRGAPPRLSSQIREVKTMNMAMRGTLAKLKSECDGLKSEIYAIKKDVTVRNAKCERH